MVFQENGFYPLSNQAGFFFFFLIYQCDSKGSMMLYLVYVYMVLVPLSISTKINIYNFHVKSI